MEVHHPSHLPTGKWTHYLWEFLMLFLAVTLGFFVENQREHYTEKLRAKDFAKALVMDLAADTTELNDVIRQDKMIVTCCDSMNSWIKKISGKGTVPGLFYFYSNIGTFSPRVVWSTATLTQMTQSGSLRFFRNTELVRKLGYYYDNISFIASLNLGDVNYRDETIRLRNRILDNSLYRNYSEYTMSQFNEISDSLLRVRLPLFNYDRALLNEYGNSFETRRRVLNLLAKQYYQEDLNNAVELINLLKKEYHLK